MDGAYLRFEMLNKSDNGLYLCKVDNGIGQSEGEYKLLVQGRTPGGASGPGRDKSCRAKVVFFFSFFYVSSSHFLYFSRLLLVLPSFFLF